MNALTPRLINALIWMVVLLVPPLAYALEGVAQLVWPSIEPFRTLGRTEWVPWVTVGVLGYLCTWVLLVVLWKWLGSEGRLAHPVWHRHGGDHLSALAIPVTVAWVVVLAMMLRLSLPLAGVAVVVLIGIWPVRQPPEEKDDQDLFPYPSPPEPLPDKSEEEYPDADDATHYHKTFSWLFDRKPYRKAGNHQRFSLHVSIPKEQYQALRAHPHELHREEDYVDVYLNPQVDDPAVTSVASQLRAIVQEQGFDGLDEIHLAMAFTLCMPYVSDDHYGRNYPKFPVEMLVDEDGDCEDFSILCGALLARLGHDVAFVLMSFPDRDAGHAALGVIPPRPIEGFTIYDPGTGQDYFHCEVTSTTTTTTADSTLVQWWVGMDPMEHAEQFRLIPIGGGAQTEAGS